MKIEVLLKGGQLVLMETSEKPMEKIWEEEIRSKRFLVTDEFVIRNEEVSGIRKANPKRYIL
jgi:hypothetical protein